MLRIWNDCDKRTGKKKTKQFTSQHEQRNKDWNTTALADTEIYNILNYYFPDQENLTAWCKIKVSLTITVTQLMNCIKINKP